MSIRRDQDGRSIGLSDCDASSLFKKNICMYVCMYVKIM